METELEIITPDSLGVTPRFMLQHHAISRSAHRFSATAKKITSMAMALLPHDLSNLTTSFTFSQFCHALGYTKSGESFKIFKEAVTECMESVIEVPTLPNKKGKVGWVMHHWFQRSEFNPDTGICTMTFDQELAEFLKELKWVYSKIELADMGRLQSRYAIRIFELAISYSSLQGKDGNPDNGWYFEKSLEELRKIFGLTEEEYKETREFRRNAIENPIKEINNAGIGVEIKTVSIKSGRNLTGIRFNNEKVARTTKKARGRKAAALPESNADAVETKESKELEHLKELYPAEFAALYAEGLEKVAVWVSQGFKQEYAVAAALGALRQKYGIVK